jgi:uncharacterized iron-regulated membrane protein
MRLLRMVVLTVLVCGLAWVGYQSMSFQATDEEFRITINRQRLREAGSELSAKSRRAVGQVGRVFERAGQAGEETETPREPASAPFGALFRR